jgi:hypothetical protein
MRQDLSGGDEVLWMGLHLSGGPGLLSSDPDLLSGGGDICCNGVCQAGPGPCPP